MKTISIGRRQVLRGAGALTIGLPFLPSIATRSALAADPVPVRRPRFLAFTSDHGAVFQDSMFPSRGMLTQTDTFVPGHEIAAGPLRRQVTGAEASLSPVLTAPADALTDRIVGKMNVLRGVDIPWYIAHHTGGHLGNYARNDGHGNGKYVWGFPMATIDHVMAWSPSFYKDLGGVRERVIYGGTRGGISWSWSNPSARSGAIQEFKLQCCSRGAFDRVFGGAEPASAGPAKRPPIVDRIRESYKRLREGNRRLSAEDRRRLDDHIARLAELERRVTQPQLTCSKTRPAADYGIWASGDINDMLATTRAWTDLVLMAFACGASRIGVVGLGSPLVAHSGSWHQMYAHEWQDASRQATIVASFRTTFQVAFLDAVRKLDAIDDGGGHSVLDNTLVTWTQESGQQTHEPISIPIVTAGSAAGFFKTGLYCDYTNRSPGNRFPGNALAAQPLFCGVSYNQWLGNVLTAMGVPKAEYEKPGVGGYGFDYLENSYWRSASGVLAKRGELLPFLRA